MKITEHFTLQELTRSKSYPHIANTPTDKVKSWLIRLSTNILEPTRIMTDRPLQVTSGYRCPKLNKAVGGVANSAHIDGRAADIHIYSDDYAQRLLDIFALNEHVDMALYEHSNTARWIHVQTAEKPRHIINRNYQV